MISDCDLGLDLCPFLESNFVRQIGKCLIFELKKVNFFLFEVIRLWNLQ